MISATSDDEATTLMGLHDMNYIPQTTIAQGGKL